MTLGYKGRLLVELLARRPMAHTAGPDAGIATVAVALWNWLDAYASGFNAGRGQTFDQLQPSLRHLQTSVDAELNDTVSAQAGIRLPLDFDAARFAGELADWAADGGGVPRVPSRRAARNYSPAASTWTARRSPWNWHSAAMSAPGAAPATQGWCAPFLPPSVSGGTATRPGFVVKTGTSDMNVVGPAWGCPILAYGPGDSALDHTPGEHIALEEILACASSCWSRRWSIWAR